MPNLLTTRSVVPALPCRFLQERHNWLAETQKHLRDLHGIEWLRISAPSDLMDKAGLLPGSVAVLEFPDSRLPELEFFRMVQALSARRICVAVVGSGKNREIALQSVLTGAACVVTAMADCDKVGAMIRRVKRRQAAVLVDWKADIEQRLPWPAPARSGGSAGQEPPCPGPSGHH
jgi:hypothetical protein